MPQVSLKAIRPKRFALIDPARVTTNVRRDMKIYLGLVRDILREDYATVPSSSRYTRKYDIYNNWQIVNLAPDGSSGELVNKTPYAVFVQGPRGGGRGKGTRQTAVMRARGWHSITDVARVTRPIFKQIINKSIGPHPGDVG